MSISSIFKYLFAGASLQDALMGREGPFPNEIFGWKIHATARAVYPLVESAFLSPYLLNLAKQHVDDEYKVSWLGLRISPLSYTSLYT